jgi:hypothetical protein
MARRERNIRLLPVVVLVRRHAGDVHVELIAASANGGNNGFAVIPAEVTAATRKRPRKGAEVPANLPTIRAKTLIFLME